MIVHTGMSGADAGLGIDWGSLLRGGIETTQDILTTRFGQPPPGTYIQGPEGTLIRATEGGALPVVAGEAKLTAEIFPPGMMPLLIGGALLIFMMFIMAKGGGGRGGR